jgi:hypothetical protein
VSLVVRLTRIAGIVLCAALFAPQAAAQIKLDRFYPSVVGAGSSATVTAEGKFPNWPCQVHCDRDDVKITPAKESGKLTVTVASPAAPGVAWVRLLDKHSASSLVPLLIEAAAVTVEQEPNNGLNEAEKVELPAVVSGRLHRSGEVDTFRVSVQAGERFVASVIGNQILRSPMDAVLQLADLQGSVLSQSDDVRGLDPQLVYQPDHDAELAVRVFAFPSTPNSTIGFAGASTFLYQLQMTTGPFLDHVSPIVMRDSGGPVTAAGWNLPGPDDLKRREATGISPAVWYSASGLGWQWGHSIDDQAIQIAAAKDPRNPATAESLPIVFTGRISEPGQVDRVRFRVASRKRYVARSHSKSAGFLLDSVLRVIDVKSGDEIVRKDDNSRTDFDSLAEFKAKADGEYELQIFDAVDAFSMRHEYAVWLGEATASVRLSVAADHFALPAGGSVQIPVTVSRNGGFAEKLTVMATGLPSGVSAEAVVSEAKGATAKSVTLKLTAGNEVSFQGNIRIVGKIDGTGKPAEAEQVATFALRNTIDLSDIWLTVSPKK